MFGRRNLAVLIGTLILSLALVIGAMPAEHEEAPQRETKTRLVQVDEVKLAPTVREARFPGVTRGTQRAALAFTLPARVAERPIQVGDRVRAGQVLARLDGSEYTLANRSAMAVLAELEARLEQAKRDEARVLQLASAKAATPEELEKTKAGTATLVAARDAAAARVDDTTRMLNETVLRAPFDGTVTNVKIEAGEWASPGKTVVELSGSDRVEVRIEVPETLHARVEAGTDVKVDLPMAARTVRGEISSVSDAAAGAGALFPIIVAIDRAEGVVPGQTAEVVLPLTSKAELTVPLAAVLDSGSSRPSVFVIEGGAARRVGVRPGQLTGDRLTVQAEGLEEGALVAVVGHTALVDGDKVEVR